MKKLIVLLLLSLFTISCTTQKSSLRIGVIKPSLNYLPLIVGLEKEIIDPDLVEITYFSSGWETNEALVAHRIDLAIMPFTYVWMDVAQGKKIYTLSFLERESDGIITTTDISRLEQLNGKKIGVLRASTLDLFAEVTAVRYNLDLDFVYFRTPMDMASALESGNVDALSFYTPSIFNLSDDFSILYWYSEDYPEHPCCNLTANSQAITDKNNLINKFKAQLHTSCEFMAENPEFVNSIASDHYHISTDIVRRSLQHMKYKMGLESKGRQLEYSLAQEMVNKGYLEKLVDQEQVYYEME